MPGLPTSFSTTCVDPSPKLNSAARSFPSRSVPLQESVTVRGAFDPELGSTERLSQSGSVFVPGVPVGVPVGCTTEKVSLHAGSTALGLTWGTLGATGVC